MSFSEIPVLDLSLARDNSTKPAFLESLRNALLDVGTKESYKGIHITTLTLLHLRISLHQEHRYRRLVNPRCHQAREVLL